MILHAHVEPATFPSDISAFPAGDTVITTSGADGESKGFASHAAVSSFVGGTPASGVREAEALHGRKVRLLLPRSAAGNTPTLTRKPSCVTAAKGPALGKSIKRWREHFGPLV